MPNIENTLKIRIENDEASTFVVIVPTDSARSHRQRELVGYHRNRAVANLRVYTLGSFIQRLYDQVRPAKLHISQGVQNLWLHEIANSQSDNPDSRRYNTFRPSQNISVPDSTLSLIADTINRLKEYGEDTLNSGNGELRNPTEDDFVRIYNDYETKLKDRWIDEQGKRLYLANAKNFVSLMMRAFPSVDLVVVEGFTALSKADIKILTHIAKMPQVEMWFRTDWLEGNEGLYKNITDLVSQFKTANARIDPDYEREPDPHQHYANNLFRTDDPCVTPIAAPYIKVLRPADRSEEVAQIAHLIQKHVSEGDCKLSDICVACYNIGLYQHRIAEIFPAYEIPYSLAVSTPLTKSEVVKAIFSFLSSDRTPLSDSYFSTVEPASDTRQFHPSEFQRYVEDLLKKGKVIHHILNPMFEKAPEVIEDEVEAYRQFNRILKELCSVLMSESVASDSLRNYIEKLHRIARHTNYRNRATTKGETVRIVQLSELRSQEFDIVFFGDFVEGSFPENYRPDPLLPNHPYRTEEEQLYNNRFMFYGALKSFRKWLYLLLPQREREADLIPSPFLEQLKAVTSIEEIEDIVDPTQGSISGFLSTYGNHVWTVGASADGKFPDEFTNMRPLIDHVVEVEKSREETHEHLAYEGVLTTETLSPESRRHLEDRRQQIYSVTELETYAQCPFQYFTGNVLRLRVEEEEEDELSSLERGSLLHRVLRTFYYNRREREEPPIGRCADGDFEKAKQQLDEILRSASEEHREKRKETSICENNLFWEMDIEKLRVALYKWIQAERTYDILTLPRYFEVGFGPRRGRSDSEFWRDPELSCTQPITIGAVRMTGQIDRIDVGNRAFNIVDYKTGNSTIRMPEILNGRSLQLPIYLQAAEKLLKTHNKIGLEPAAGLYHKIRLDECKVELGIGKKSLDEITFEEYKNREWKKVHSRSGQLLEDEYFAQMLERVSGYVQQYVDSISKGNFPLITRVKTFSVHEEESEEGCVVETDEYGFVDSEEHGDKPLTPRNKTQPCNYCAYKRTCRIGAISESSQSDG